MATSARREIAIWKKEAKLDKRLRLIFPRRFRQPYSKYSWGVSYEYLSGSPESTEREITGLCLCHTILINFKVKYHKLKKCLNSRSSHRSCSIEKTVLKNFLIFRGKHLCWSLLLIDLRALRPATFFKRDSNTGVFLRILENC